MPDYSAGTASVEISPDFRNFVRELRAKLDAVDASLAVDIKPDTTTFGRELQTELSKFDAELSVDIKPDTTGFEADLNAKIAGLTPEVQVKVEPDETSLNALEGKIQARLDRMRLGATVRVDADTSMAAAEIATLRRLVRRMTLNVGADTSAARREIDRLNGRNVNVNVNARNVGGTIGGGGGRGGLLDTKLLLGGALAVSQLPAAATALASIGPDIQALGQSIALLPGLFAGAAAGAVTLGIGLDHMKDAFSDSPKKAAKAYAALSTEGKKVVDELKTFGPQWDRIKDGIQNTTLDGLSKPLNSLLTAQLPALESGMNGLAGGFNSIFKTGIAELSNDQSTSAVSTIFGNTTAAAAQFNGAIVPIISSFRTLATTGSSFLPQLAQGFTNLATRFDVFLSKSKDSGDLSRWMQEGIHSVTQLSSILANLGSSFASLFRAAKGSGDGFLTTVDNLTTKMASWLKSTDGQTELRQFFIQGREQLHQWEPILTNVGTILKSVYTATQAWSGILMPFLQAASSLLGQHQGLVTTLLTAYLAFRTLNPIFTGLQSGISTFTTAMSTAATAGAGTFKAGLAGLSAVLGGGGVFGLALVGASIGLGYLAQKHQEAKAAADAQRAALEQLGTTLDKQTGKVTAETISAGAQQLEKTGFLKRAQSFGIDTNTYTRASLGLAPLEKDAINQQLTQTILEQVGNKKFGEWTLANNAGLTDVEIAQALQGIPEAVQKYRDANLTFDLSELKEKLNDVGESAATLGGEMNGTNTEIAKMGEAAQRTNAAINGTFQLTEQGKQAFADLGLAVQSVPDAKTITVSSTTAEQEQKLKDLGYTIEHLPDGTVKLTANDEQARAVIAQLLKPETKTVKVVYDSVGEQYNVGARQAANPGSGDNKTATGGNVGGRALGGAITGGVAGKDSVPSMLMPGEHVLTTSDVSNLGGQAGVYRFRSALQAGLVRPFASGGAVGWTPEDETKLQSANTAVTQAEERAAKAHNNPKASQADRDQADLAVTKAKQKAAKLQTKKDNGGKTPKTYVPQAELPKAKSENQISIENAKAAVDTANTKRNQVYANPDSTDAEKLAADNDYLSAQNSLTSTQKKSNSGSGTGIESYSLQGIFSRAGTILADGLLSGLGLEGSILSSNNVYNKALNSVVEHYTNADGTTTDTTNDYSYTPQNLEVDDKDTDTSSETDNGDVTASGAEQWRPTFVSVLKALDMPSSWVTKGLQQLMTESGGNPKAQNNSDSNAAAGTPSKGLMQVIDPTFAAYRSTLYANDIWNPSANIAAALRYTVDRYGSPENVWGQGHGYADGGWVTGTGGPRSDSVRALLSPTEFVVNAASAQANAPYLEAINAGATLTAPKLPKGFGTSSTSQQTVTRDHSVQFNAPVQVMDVDHLFRETDRWTSMQAQGALAAL